jgi:hypothetical protein
LILVPPYLIDFQRSVFEISRECPARMPNSPRLLTRLPNDRPEAGVSRAKAVICQKYRRAIFECAAAMLLTAHALC